jgi:hypothetical protein
MRAFVFLFDTRTISRRRLQHVRKDTEPPHAMIHVFLRRIH